MKKIAFEVVDFEISKMYAQADFSTTDLDKIDVHCKKIESFLDACGWGIDNYIDELLARGLKEFLTPPKDQSN